MSDSDSKSLSSDNSEQQTAQKGSFNFWRWFWLSFLVLSLAYAWHSFYVPPNRIAWAENFTAAQQKSASSGQRMILYFTGTWCVPCRIMKRQVWADVEVMKKVNSQFVPVAIDFDDPDAAPLLKRYNIKGPPVTIVTDSEGNALDWRAGGISKSEFFDLLDLKHPAGA